MLSLRSEELNWLTGLLLGQEDFYLYPDMAAYRSIAVTLGQGGLVRELMKLIECVKQKPAGKINHLRRKNWDPVLNPDLVVFNAVRILLCIRIIRDYLACPVCNYRLPNCFRF